MEIYRSGCGGVWFFRRQVVLASASPFWFRPRSSPSSLLLFVSLAASIDFGLELGFFEVASIPSSFGFYRCLVMAEALVVRSVLMALQVAYKLV
ncbi:unnamed protein product [Thlaspi arvense]|uniref:NADH dehydrogenase subunit 4L n=1 Tax=Thlaspi arvense TaxID=13288 RepID=A0AAU9S1I6_THLAR|nr:unnamed protein product [Thlaspi arvense]